MKRVPLPAPEGKVLVVDDNKVNLTVIKGLLRKTECRLPVWNEGKTVWK